MAAVASEHNDTGGTDRSDARRFDDETLVCRLAGPMQAWGSSSKFTTRSTDTTPTYSALVGMLRCVSGLRGIEDEAADLLGRPMVVRVDSRGRVMSDYHTVNPPDRRAYAFLSAKERDALFTVPTGEGKAWKVGPKGGPSTLPTRREYLNDAVFTLFVGSHEGDTLAERLAVPMWAPFLGRKSCPPAWPFFLGAYRGSVAEAIRAVPRWTTSPLPSVAHVLAGDMGDGSLSIVVNDGWDHTSQTHTAHSRSVFDLEVPEVESIDELLNWCKENMR